MRIQNVQPSVVTAVKIDQLRRRHTQGAAETNVRLADGLQLAVRRRSRPRTAGLGLLLAGLARPAQNLRQILNIQRRPAASTEMKHIDVYV